MSFKSFSSGLNTDQKTVEENAPKAAPAHDQPAAPAAKTPADGQTPVKG